MHLNEELIHYKKITRPRPREEKIQETIQRSMEIFFNLLRKAEDFFV